MNCYADMNKMKGKHHEKKYDLSSLPGYTGAEGTS